MSALSSNFSSSLNLNEEIKCSICICNGNSPKKVILACRHIFCAPCVGTWIKNHETCPECRTIIPLTSTEKKERLQDENIAASILGRDPDHHQHFLLPDTAETEEVDSRDEILLVFDRYEIQKKAEEVYRSNFRKSPKT